VGACMRACVCGLLVLPQEEDLPWTMVHRYTSLLIHSVGVTTTAGEALLLFSKKELELYIILYPPVVEQNAYMPYLALACIITYCILCTLWAVYVYVQIYGEQSKC